MNIPEDGTEGRLGDHIFRALDPFTKCWTCGVEAYHHGNKLGELYDRVIEEWVEAAEGTDR